MSKPIIFMLVGLPSSGKSTWAKMNAEKLNAKILSSDSIREEWYGDASIQGDNNKLFEYMHNQAKILLSMGKDVIVDSTNINSKRRKQFNHEFKKFERKVIYFNSSPTACILRDKYRERTVGKQVIMKMFKNLQIPTYAEGWNSIEIVYDKHINPFSRKEYYEKKILNNWNYEDMFSFPYGLGEFGDFSRIYEMPQDNPHHTFSVSRHTYYVYQYVYDNYKVDDVRDYLKMLWVALLHDIGKGYTKTFINLKGEPKRHASFYGHENASGQIACSILHSLGYDDSFILGVVELVQLHMKILNATTEKSIHKLKNSLEDTIYCNLELLFEADTSAK